MSRAARAIFAVGEQKTEDRLLVYTDLIMKGAVLTDVRGNLPALEVALDAIRHEGCDAIYHYTLVKYAVHYDDRALLRAFEERNVPECEVIRRSYFGR